MAAIVLLMIVPQRRQRKKQAELMSAIGVGDEVVTIGGMHGVVNHIEGDDVHLEVDDDVVVKFSLGAVSTLQLKHVLIRFVHRSKTRHLTMIVKNCKSA